ncbi:MAG: hypothetical protein JNL24_12480 [Bacteroidia bacterium]|nr:hypothetical protein [Bacteroidia bacterium]
MKKTFTFLFFSIALLSIAQDIDYANVKADYTRLPLTPLKKEVKNYQVLVLADYLQKNEQLKTTYQANAKAAETEYAAASKKYWEARKQDSLNVENQLNVWFRLTPAQQAVTPKPTFIPQPAPVKTPVVEPLYDKVFNTDLLASQNIKLEGFNRLPEKAAIIQLNLTGFEYQEPVLTTQKKSVKGADGVMTEVIYYLYQFNYRHVIKIKILGPDGKYVLDESFAPSMNYASFRSKEFATQAELDAYWATQKNTEIASVQEKVVMDNLRQINEQLNNNYGFVPQTRYAQVAFVDAKSKYEDLKEALVSAKSGYASISQSGTYQQGVDQLNAAILKWETALKESNLKSKKARVNENVTEALLMNLGEAYVWLGNYTKAQEYIFRLQTFKLSAKEKRLVAGTEAFLNDQKLRAEKNK